LHDAPEPQKLRPSQKATTAGGKESKGLDYYGLLRSIREVDLVLGRKFCATKTSYKISAFSIVKTDCECSGRLVVIFGISSVLCFVCMWALVS
jgi:hypothetical protein